MNTQMYYFVSKINLNSPFLSLSLCFFSLRYFVQHTVDQPAGTGYSYVTKNDNVRELADSADQVVNFLENLYQIFPEYATMDVRSLSRTRL